MNFSLGLLADVIVMPWCALLAQCIGATGGWEGEGGRGGLRGGRMWRQLRRGLMLEPDYCHYNCSSQRQSGGEEKRDSHQCARVNNDMISLALIERLKNDDVEFLVSLQYIGE